MLPHGFIKKIQATSQDEIRLAESRIDFQKEATMPIGGNFDDFLKEEGIYESCTAAAMKKALAWQIKEEMKAQHLTKTAMAQKMHTSA